MNYDQWLSAPYEEHYANCESCERWIDAEYEDLVVEYVAEVKNNDPGEHDDLTPYLVGTDSKWRGKFWTWACDEWERREPWKDGMP